MPLYTLSHCLFCFKKNVKGPVKPPSSPPLPSSNDESVQTQKEIHEANLNELHRRKEICARFCILSTRYLKLDPYHFFPEKTIRSKRKVNVEFVCDECLPAIDSFCQIYQSLEYLRLQLECRVQEIGEIMVNAESENRQFKEELVEQLKALDDSPADINDFRNEFITAVTTARRTESFPRVRLPKCDGLQGNGTMEPDHLLKQETKEDNIPVNSDSDSDGSIFTPVLIKSKAFKRQNDDKELNRASKRPKTHEERSGNQKFENEERVSSNSTEGTVIIEQIKDAEEGKEKTPESETSSNDMFSKCSEPNSEKKKKKVKKSGRKKNKEGKIKIVLPNRSVEKASSNVTEVPEVITLSDSDDEKKPRKSTEELKTRVKRKKKKKKNHDDSWTKETVKLKS